MDPLSRNLAGVALPTQMSISGLADGTWRRVMSGLYVTESTLGGFRLVKRGRAAVDAEPALELDLGWSGGVRFEDVGARL